MLEGIRRGAKNWLGKTVLTILFGTMIISFAIWGIGDIFRGIGVSNVAEIGSTHISTVDFRNAYQTQLQNLQRQARRAITNDQARAYGLDRQVLGRMIADAALDQKVAELRLAMSDEDIARSILEDPTFKGPDGRFDRGRFNDILRDNGYNEMSFVRDQRRVYLRRELGDALSGNVKPPEATVEAIHHFANETRSTEYFVLSEAAAGDIAQPSPADLQAYFDARKANWRAPEYRKVVTLAITPQTLADPAQVSDADARAQYDRIKGERFGQAETRELQQIVFPNEDEAKAASEKIKAGASFADVAKERNLADADINLGTVARPAIADPAVAEAAFTTPSGEVSAPVKTRFGYALVRVGAVTPANVRSFEEVASAVRQELAVSRARTRVQQVHDQIEDERSSGKPLADAAKTAGFDVTTIEAADQTGLDKKGDKVALTEAESVLRAVFASDIGVDNEAVNTRDNGYVWFEIAGTEPAHERKLDEVKDEVTKAWRDDELRRVLATKASDLAKAIDGGQSVEDAAKANGAEVKTSTTVKRGGAEGLSPGLVAQVFNTQVGKAGSAAGDGLTRIVFKVNDSVTPPFEADSEEAKSIAGQLATTYSDDILTQYLAKVQSELGVKINAGALNLAMGGGDAY
ncbi:MAG: Peptidylprolyl isomerase [Hyphomicrobiales bacterium]|nr:Peptidylprolyl isomerase [Hyphomicrobiales bacterium]